MMIKKPIQIINIEELSKIIGRNRTRINRYIAENRFPIDFIDNNGHRYWTIETARTIRDLLERHRKEVGSGRGYRINFLEPQEITRVAHIKNLMESIKNERKALKQINE